MPLEVFELCERTDRQTSRHIHLLTTITYNTSHVTVTACADEKEQEKDTHRDRETECDSW